MDFANRGLFSRGPSGRLGVVNDVPDEVVLSLEAEIKAGAARERRRLKRERQRHPSPFSHGLDTGVKGREIRR